MIILFSMVNVSDQQSQNNLGQDLSGQNLPVDDLYGQQTGGQQPVQAIPTAGREEKEAGSPVFKEAEPAVVEKKEFELPKEVKSWVKEEKKEETRLSRPIKDEYGQILMESAAPSKPKIVLPLTQGQAQIALKKKIIESVRWLAEWCLRIIKMFPKRTSYKTT